MRWVGSLSNQSQARRPAGKPKNLDLCSPNSDRFLRDTALAVRANDDLFVQRKAEGASDAELADICITNRAVVHDLRLFQQRIARKRARLIYLPRAVAPRRIRPRSRGVRSRASRPASASSGGGSDGDGDGEPRLHLVLVRDRHVVGSQGAA